METKGLLKSDVPGRTDRLDITVEPDSYVIPADVVSGLAQGNTQGGAKIFEQILDALETSHMASGGRIKNPHVVSIGMRHRKNPVPILAAGGEYVVPFNKVAMIGNGNVRKGHAILDRMVRHVRRSVAKRMLKLPGPKS